MWSTLGSVLPFLLCFKFFLCHGIPPIPNPTGDARSLSLSNFKWECSSQLNCTVEGSSCLENECQCHIGYIFNGGLTRCLKVATNYDADCEETVQCSAYLLSGGICKDNKCACASGYHYLHGRCNPSSDLFEKCRSDDDCYINADFEATSCFGEENSKICKCSDGFYQREYRNCRREGKHVGSECAIDLDCRFENSYCENNACAVKTKELRPRLQTNTFLSDENPTITIGSSCKTNKDCESIKNSVCGPLGECTCQRAYFSSSNKGECLPELGESCKEGDKHSVSFFICRNGRWSCSGGKVASKNNQQCKKTTKIYNGSCLSQEQCYIFGPDSSCESKKCVCNDKSHFVESEMFCWRNRNLGEECDSDNDCFMNNFTGSLVCTNKKCDCPKGFHLNSNKTACVDSVELGMACATNEECAPINATCTNEACTCKENFVAVSNGSCAPLSSHGEKCEYDVQCSTLVPNTVCLSLKNSGDELTNNATAEDNKLCSCIDNYHYRFDSCQQRKVLGETCAKLGECYLQSDIDKAVCKNEVCACTWGYYEVNNTFCAKGNSAAIVTPTIWLLALIFLYKF